MSNVKSSELNLFSRRLKFLRGQKTQAAFARKLGVSAPLYHQWENGATPTMEKLLLIASKCDVPIDWLLSGVDDKRPLSIESSGEFLSKAAAYDDCVARIHNLEEELHEARAVIRDQAAALAAALAAKPSPAADLACGASDRANKDRREA